MSTAATTSWESERTPIGAVAGESAREHRALQNRLAVASGCQAQVRIGRKPTAETSKVETRIRWLRRWVGVLH